MASEAVRLHVTISFTGDAMAFSITPTTSTLGLKADVREDYLVIEVHDDHQTQSRSMPSSRPPLETWQISVAMWRVGNLAYQTQCTLR